MTRTLNTLSVNALWAAIHTEVQAAGAAEPILDSFLFARVLSHHSLAAALAFHLAAQLDSTALSAAIINQLFIEVLADDDSIVTAASCDIQAHYNRDPACDGYAMPFLYFKGFHALQAYRLSHYLWGQGRRALALFLQSRIASVYDVDIHPAARLGSSIMIDHATAVVIGETAVVGNQVSLLHGVTLGGIGAQGVDRHPKIADGVLISTGAKLLGNIHIGEGAKIAAGTVVMSDVPAHTTVAGVPFRVIGRPSDSQPALNMDQRLTDPDKQ